MADNDNLKMTDPGVDILMMLEEEHIGQAHRIPADGCSIGKGIRLRMFT